MKTHTRTIRGLEVKCTQFAVMRAYALLHELVKAMGPSIAQLDELKFNAASIPAVTGALIRASDDTRRAVTRSILAGCAVTVEGNFIQLCDDKNTDAALGCDVLALFEIITFALEVNFGDFFDAVQSVVLGAAEAAKEKAEAEAKDAGSDSD